MNIRISTISVLAILTFALAMFALGSKPRTARKVVTPPSPDVNPGSTPRPFTQTAPGTRVESAKAPPPRGTRSAADLHRNIAEMNAQVADILKRAAPSAFARATHAQ